MKDYNYNVFLVGKLLREDPANRFKQKKTKPASKKFWIAVFVIIGIVVAFGIFEMIGVSYAGM